MMNLIGKGYDSFSTAEPEVLRWVLDNKLSLYGLLEKRRDYRNYAVIGFKNKPCRIYIIRTDFSNSAYPHECAAYFFSTAEEGHEYVDKLAKKRQKEIEKQREKEVQNPIPEEDLNKPWHNDGAHNADDKQSSVGQIDRQKGRENSREYQDHNEIRDNLTKNPGKSFVVDFSQRVYSWASKLPAEAFEYKVFPELTIRYLRDGEKTRMGLDKYDHYRFDAVLMVKPGMRSVNQHQYFTVGIELKGTKEDLKRDNKIVKYLGWTDFMFLGGPEHLQKDLLAKVEELDKQYPEHAGKIGVMSTDTGIVNKLPKRQDVPDGHRIDMLNQIVYNTIFKTLDKYDVVSVDMNDVEVLSAEIKDPMTIKSVTTAEGTPNSSPNLVSVISDNSEKDDGKDSEADKEKPRNTLTLSDQEKEERAKQREANRQRLLQEKKEIEKKNSTLMPQTREKLAGLSDRDQIIFWTIRGTGTDGIDAQDLPAKTGQSSASVSRSIATLRKNKLITLDGSKKTGKFKVIGDAAKDSRCMTCALMEKCQGNSLMCGTYQPVSLLSL
jgi:hypothetical protein